MIGCLLACFYRATCNHAWLRVEDQKTADDRIPLLLETPAAVRFVSAEPLLGPVELTMLHWPKDDSFYDSLGRQRKPFNDYGTHGPQVDWVICGGESGHGARPMQIEWARSLREQCAEASVPFFMKQLDGKRKSLADFPDDLRVREFPNA